MNRRSFLRRAGFSVGLLAGASVTRAVPGWPIATLNLGLADRFPAAVRLRRVELVRTRLGYFSRVVSEAGEMGVAPANRQPQLSSLFNGVVAPFFTGQDARHIESLVDGVYTHASNYKYAGMPFWNCVAQVELAILDLLGKQADLTVGALLGRPRRREIPVYISRFNRDNPPEEEVEGVAQALAQTGAQACKLKIGLRMDNNPAQTRRDLKMIELARQRLGPEVAIYVDANSSYSAEEAIRIGRQLESHQVAFLEEPCPWQDYEMTQQVTRALDLPVAGGEQDSSQSRFRWMIQNRCVDIVQPDVYYNGGLIRALRIAKVAEQAGLLFTPHSPKTGREAAPNLQLASLVPNLGPHQEYREAPEVRQGRVLVPNQPGLGVAYEPDEWNDAHIIA